MRLYPVTALEGIHEGMEGLRSQSAAVETLVEAATRVDSQKESRQGHEDRADDNGYQSIREVCRAKVLHGTIVCSVVVLKSVSIYIISRCEGQNLDACVQYFYRGEEDEGGKYLDEGSANVPGVAMAMYTPLERSPHPHHQPVPLVICSDQHIGHEDEEERIESH